MVKRVVITGGSGYIGSRLSLFLANSGFEVIPVCHNLIPDDISWQKAMFKILTGSLTEIPVLLAIQELNPDVIIHLVSLDHNRSGVNISETLEINVETTWSLLSLCELIGGCKFIYFSTVQVYGNNESKVITENVQARPINAYGLTHLMSEEVVSFFHRTQNIEGVCLRLSNCYGEPLFEKNSNWELVVNNLCMSAFLQHKIVLKTNGRATRDFIHYSDVCKAVFELIYFEKIKYGVYNLSTGVSISLLDLALIIRDVYNNKFNRKIDIYINSDELVDYKNFYITENPQVISNGLLSANINLNFKLIENGISEILDYLGKRGK